MSSIKEHRIYSYMSQPVRFIGLTFDEMGLGIFCFSLFYIFESMILKAVFALVTPASVYVVKKLKKIAAGFSMISFLHWNLGLRFGLSDYAPSSWKRRYWG